MTSVFADLMGEQKEPSAMEEFNKECKLSYTTVRMRRG